MAKKTSLEDALENVVKDLDIIVERTAKRVTKKAMDDLGRQTKKIVKHYYDSYRPELYDRKSFLYHAFRISDNTFKNSVSVIVEFDPDLLWQHKSRSKYHQTGNVWEPIIWPYEQPEGNNYGVPEPDWILDNFWEGIHPRSYGSKYKGFTYEPKIDMKSPQDLFNEFVDANGSYMNKILKPYANEIFTHEVLKALKRQLR